MLLRILTIACLPLGQLGDTRYIDHCKQRLADDVFPWILNAYTPFAPIIVALAPQTRQFICPKTGCNASRQTPRFPKDEENKEKEM